MKTLEIKRFNIGSVIKSTLYLYFIPIILFVIVGLFIFLITMIEEPAMGMGLLLGGLIGIVFYSAIYFGIIALIVLIYNWLAGKFGGLTFTVEEKQDEYTDYNREAKEYR
ncbi:hypothetical protein [Alkalihalobacillus pseudalcaliphilus]|uniref:hypothetical protein n=1 Tax=Alkalihalobacillus pseudalcaliphilus TaxID=79884 RepID=UPI00064D76BE|nr:hypothetical protein [Alkalihalobacillus pseudalcaliphilus]KMK75823.1 hypothetical protein AB990_11200 [Alkalihalobacillus pseudalcaliphilus]